MQVYIDYMNILWYICSENGIAIFDYSCSVAKRITPSASGSSQDLDLDNDYYVLYGQRRGSSVAGSLTPHEMGPANNPRISSSTVNPTGRSGDGDTTTTISGLTAPVKQ